MTPYYYHPNPPRWLELLAEAPEMARLRGVGMNCGCEYTRFERFRGLAPYTRHRHSLGAALIVHRFTGDAAQTCAALFHDIATPAFAHAVDFLHGDYLTQESTEAGTEAILRASPAIREGLDALGLTVDDVKDYHRYPIADNDSPRLSADRLEYTLGNLENFGRRDPKTLKAWYDDLTIVQAEDGAPELAFAHEDAALAFGMDALWCSRIYVSDEDRYAMQSLAELLRAALDAGALNMDDLYRTEDEVIARLNARPDTREAWRRYRALHRMVRDPDAAPPHLRRVIPAKKRCIDPLVQGRGRLSQIHPDFHRALATFLATPQDGWLYGE